MIVGISLPYLPECLSLSLSKGHARFDSDNLSTMSVIKEVMSKEATRKKIQVKITHGMR